MGVMPVRGNYSKNKSRVRASGIEAKETLKSKDINILTIHALDCHTQ
jgi:hypothetical protein